MVSETEKSTGNNGFSKSSEVVFEKKKKTIETYSIVALFILIAAVLLNIF